MKLLLSGSSGLLGSRVYLDAIARQDEVGRLLRSLSWSYGGRDVYWNPATYELSPTHLSGYDAVVHVAGDGIANGRWSAKKKQRIRDSRVIGTQKLVEALLKTEVPPKVFVCASAVGYYGSRGDELLTEKSAMGSGFLSQVCQEWEHAAEPLKAKGVRVVNLRFGMMLSPDGGALQRMLLPFRLGLGGPLGDGMQYLSWIALSDAVRAVRFAIENDKLQGPVNVVSPNPVRNSEYTQILGDVLVRPTVLPAPAFGLKLLLGEMAEGLLLSSQRVKPEELEKNGFKFDYADLRSCLSALLA